MNPLRKIKSKIYTREKLAETLEEWRNHGHKVVFTNGCFDILHPGHIDYLAKSASLAGKFIVAVNSDASVSRLKGKHRPLQNQESRMLLLAALAFTDAIVLFEEDTPDEIISILMPDILVKGGDYSLHQIVGAQTVIKNGGSVAILPLLNGFSTTSIELKISSKG